MSPEPSDRCPNRERTQGPPEAAPRRWGQAPEDLSSQQPKSMCSPPGGKRQGGPPILKRGRIYHPGPYLPPRPALRMRLLVQPLAPILDPRQKNHRECFQTNSSKPYPTQTVEDGRAPAGGSLGSVNALTGGTQEGTENNQGPSTSETLRWAPPQFT